MMLHYFRQKGVVVVMLIFIFLGKVWATEKEILEIARVSLPGYDLIEFDPKGNFVVILNSKTKNVEILDIKTLQIKTLFLTNEMEIDEIKIFPGSYLILTSNKEKNYVWSINDNKLLYEFANENAKDKVLSNNASFICSILPNNTIQINNILTQTSNYYDINTSVFKDKPIGFFKKGVISRDNKMLYLLTAQYQNEAPSLRYGIKVVLYSFDLEKQGFVDAQEIFVTNDITYTIDDLTTFNISPNGELLVVGVKLKIIQYDVKKKEKRVINNLEKILKVAFDSGGNYMVSSGQNTTNLWEITSENKIRLLKHFVGSSTNLCISADNKYIFTLSEERSMMVALDIREAKMIRTNPGLYIKRCTQKLAKIRFEDWVKRKPREKLADYNIRTSESNKEAKKSAFLDEALKKFCREVFEVSTDYFVMVKNSMGNYVTLETDGFLPVNIAIDNRKELDNFIKFFNKGFYKWRNIDFGIVDNQIGIKRTDLHLNYGKTYFYEIQNDPHSRAANNFFELFYADYNLNEKIE